MKVQNALGLCIAVALFILGHADLVSKDASLDFSIVDKGLLFLIVATAIALNAIVNEVRNHIKAR